MRNKKEINEYMNEAFDKVWYMRSHPCEVKEIEEKRLKEVERIENQYPEVKEYDEFDFGYWSGILSTTRWVMGDDKDFLDT